MLMLKKSVSYFMNKSFSNTQETEYLSAISDVQWPDK